MTQLVELQNQIEEFSTAGLKVYGVSYDPQGVLKRFSDKYGITYDLHSDVGSVVIGRFGILNTLIDPNDPRAAPFYGIPFPGTYVVDESGAVTEKFFNRHYATRTSAGTILDTALGRALVRKESPQRARREQHAKVTAFLSDKDLKLEVVNTLHVRLEMAEGLHVYAEPLPKGFYPTTVTVESSAGLKLGEPIYPPTTPRRFEALGVTLNVYEGVVDIAVPITRTPELDRLLEQRSRLGFAPRHAIELKVLVKYQACSETLCYLPQTVRLTVDAPLAELVMPTFGR